MKKNDCNFAVEGRTKGGEIFFKGEFKLIIDAIQMFKEFTAWYVDLIDCQTGEVYCSKKCGQITWNVLLLE